MKNNIPTSGLAILTRYIADKSEGQFLLCDISDGNIFIDEKFLNIKISDNVLGLIGICRACQYCVEKDFIGKVYSCNQTSFEWAIKKRHRSRISSPKVIRLLNDNLPTLSLYDFEDVIALWDPAWGDMRHALNIINGIS